MTRIEVQEPLIPFVRAGIHLLAVAFGVVLLIQVWGYDVTGLVAGLGIGGLAISLAAQDTIANLFGFSMIVGDRPFAVCEFIKTPDVEGIVERVGFRSTRVRQLNQALVTVPNSTLANSAILNWSRLHKRWIDFILHISYGASPEQLEALMESIRSMLRNREAVDPDSVVVHFINFGDSALEILIRAYVAKPQWLEFTQEREQVNLELMRIVKAAGLSIAYPSRSLYIERMPGMGGGRHDGLPAFDREMRHNLPSDDSHHPGE